MIKGIVFDIDDTLYSNKIRKVPALTIKALKKLNEKGIKTGICTSRSIAEMSSIPEDLLGYFDCYFLNTGAIAVMKDGTLRNNQVISADLAQKYIDYFNEHNISYHFADINGDQCYWGDKRIVEVDGFLSNCKNIYYQEYNNEDLTVLGFVLEKSEQLDEIRNINPEAFISVFGKSCLISPDFIDKGMAVVKFCSIFGLKIDEVATFGDGSNDDMMFKSSGLGIAVKGANPKAVAAADYVTKKTIENGGIYDALVDLKIIEEDVYDVKAFFFDNDSTLFDHSEFSNGEHIHKSTYEALEKLRENGYKTCMITSRSYDEMYNVPKEFLELFDDVNLLSGAYCMHKDGSVDYLTIDHDIVVKAIKMFDELGLTYRYCTTDGGGYLNKHDQEIENLFYTLYEMVPPIKTYANEEVCHLLFYASEEVANRIYEELKDVEFSFLGRATELSPLGIDKGSSLEKTAKAYGLSLDETCAFGDSANDVSMFLKAKLAIALGNGQNAAKKHADYITDNIWEDGVYNALKHFDFIK